MVQIYVPEVVEVMLLSLKCVWNSSKSLTGDFLLSPLWLGCTLNYSVGQ